MPSQHLDDTVVLGSVFPVTNFSWVGRGKTWHRIVYKSDEGNVRLKSTHTQTHPLANPLDTAQQRTYSVIYIQACKV